MATTLIAFYKIEPHLTYNVSELWRVSKVATTLCMRRPWPIVVTCWPTSTHRLAQEQRLKHSIVHFCKKNPDARVRIELPNSM
jgi:hypothetical protein